MYKGAGVGPVRLKGSGESVSAVMYTESFEEALELFHAVHEEYLALFKETFRHKLKRDSASRRKLKSLQSHATMVAARLHDIEQHL